MMSINDLRKRKWFSEAIFAFGFIAVALLLIAPYLIEGTLFLGSDGVSLFATKKYYIDSLFSGDFAFWNKYLLGGMPSEIGGTITYPPLLIFGLLPLKAFVRCYYCFHLALGAFFTYKYLTQIKCKSQVAFVVAILYECSIHLGGLRKDHIGIITAVTILPMVMFFAHKYLDEGKFKWLVACAFGMSLQVSANVFQQAFYTDVLVFFYIVVIAIINKTAIKKLIKDVGLWIATYLGMSALVLVPTAMIISYFSSMAESNSYDNFLTFSINYYKLLQMIFPKVYCDVYGWNTVMDSSEMNIELFLGTMCFAILVFTVIRYRKVRMVRVSSIIMLISLIYASIGHIPYLRMLVYVMPIFGGFRVPSRALFIFIFFAFVLIAIGISEIFKKGEMKLFNKRFLQGAVVISGLVILFGVACLIYINVTGAYSLQELGEYMLEAFVPSIAAVIVTIVLLWVINRMKVQDSMKQLLCLGLITLVTLVEVFPFQSESNSTPDEYFDISEQTIALRDDLGDYKVLEAFDGQFNGTTSIVSNNMSVQREIASINAYVPFNYPYLYRMLNEGDNCMLSDSGAMIGSPLMEYTLRYENDVLSMLGVKYILDTSGLLTEEYSNDSEESADNAESEAYCILEVDDIEVPFSEEQELGIWTSPIDIEPNSVYEIDLVVESSAREGFIEVDLYGGKTYDSSDSESIQDVEYGENHFRIRMNSGDSSLTEEENSIRVYCTDGSLSRIVSLRVDKIDTSEVLGTDSSFVTTDSIEQQQVFEASDIVIWPNINGMFMWQEPIELEPYTDYKIDIVLDVHPISGEMIVDLYGGRTYDSNDQNYNCIVRRGETHIETIFNSGDTSRAIRPINIRIFSFDGATRDIISVQVEKVVYETDNYLFYGSLEDGTIIYENPNVNDVLYVPQNVEHVDSFNTMLDDIVSYDFKDTAYVEEDIDMTINQEDTRISNIDFSNNMIEAHVSSTSESFIMFSQSYYPGWKAYIDGEEAKLYYVSGTIMGVVVPLGEHEIRFEYVPVYSYIGLGITGATYASLIFVAVAILVTNKRKRNVPSSTQIKTTVKET